MTKTTHLSGLKILAIMVVAIIGLVLWAQYFPWMNHLPSESSAELEKIRSALPTAETRWKSSGITDYDVDAVGFNHPGGCADFSKKDKWLYPLHLRIRQGQILYENEQQKQWAEMCHFETFLPPQVFETMMKYLESSHPNAFYLTAEFDSTYGFLKNFHLLSNQLAPDPNISYEFTNLKPAQNKP